jgi:DNA (cytosine-5)-methyltransferase 1
MDFVDLFCGMGTIRMGFEQAGHTCVYSVEWDKHKRRIYEVIFGHEPEGSDITAVRENDIPTAGCWTFGAPCQDFSIAGMRRGLDGDRSSLVREVFRLVRETPEEHRPEWLLYENVKGMLSSNKGLDYLEILSEMASLGYDIEWQLLNSKDFGVPQNRERVYTLGHFGTRGERKVFPIGSDSVPAAELQRQCSNTLTARYCGAQAVETYISEREQLQEVRQIGNVMPTVTRDNPNQGRVYDTDGIAPTLGAIHGGGLQPHIIEPHGILFTQKKITRETDIANTLTARNPSTSRGNYTPITGIAIFPNGVSDADTAFTLKAGKHGPAGVDGNHPQNGVKQGTRIRRLTPRECMRLQGVADNITDKLIATGISDTQLYRAAGDACTVNVIYEIARKLS